MNLQAKKSLLKAIPYGLYVVGVKGHDTVNAFTGTWVSQCSLKPPMIMLGIRKDAYSYTLLQEGRVLSLNFLGKDKQSVFEHFFKPVKQEGSRLAGVPFHTDHTGAPILDEAIGYLEGHVKDIHETTGDHAVVIAEITHAVITKVESPLILADTPWSYGG